MTSYPDPTTPIVDKQGRLNRFWTDFILKQIASLEPLETSATLADVIAAHNALITAAKNAKVMK